MINTLSLFRSISDAQRLMLALLIRHVQRLMPAGLIRLLWQLISSRITRESTTARAPGLDREDWPYGPVGSCRLKPGTAV